MPKCILEATLPLEDVQGDVQKANVVSRLLCKETLRLFLAFFRLFCDMRRGWYSTVLLSDD